MREIGGYLGCEESAGKEFYDNVVRLNSGRNCLRYLLQEKNIKQIALPYYICDAVIDVCKKENCEIIFYHLDKKLLPIISEGALNKETYIYIVNYFGQLSDADIIQHCRLYKNIIVDNSQAFFRPPIEGIDTLYTCRKFFGVPDGGYLYPVRNLKGMERDVSYDRCIHLWGRFELGASEFYNCYSDNEKRIDELPVREMSLLTQNLLRGINYEHVKDVRTHNYSWLNSVLKTDNELVVKNIEGGFMYPFLIKNGDKLRKYLIENRIYTPVLWVNVLQGEAGEWEKKLTRNLVCIPCDQRYNTEDMDYIISVIDRWRKEECK